MLDRGREATLRSKDRAPPSARSCSSEVNNGPGLEDLDPGSEVAQMGGGKVLDHLGSPPLGRGPSTLLKNQKLFFSFFFFRERKTSLPMF